MPVVVAQADCVIIFQKQSLFTPTKVECERDVFERNNCGHKSVLVAKVRISWSRFLTRFGGLRSMMGGVLLETKN